jgi:glutamate carboxypeptidase
VLLAPFPVIINQMNLQIDKLTSHLQQNHHSKMMNLLRRLVEVESPTSEPERQAPVFDILEEAFSNLCYAVERLPGNHSGGQLAAWSRRDVEPLSAESKTPFQLLLGHCDTVWPVGTLEKMPFRIEDGRIMGPGVYDMKGGLVQMIMALDALQALNLQPAIMPLICVNSDEETGSRESRPLIGRLARKASRAFILEPALGLDGKLKTRRKGVGLFLVNVQGQAAHAGLDPDKGVSAILELSYVIQKLHALNNPAEGVRVNVGVINGGTQPNVIAPSSSAEIDVRVPNQESAEGIEKAIQRITPELKGTTIQMTGGFNRLPMEKTEANERLWKLAEDKGRELNLSLQEGMAGGGSDGNTTSLYTATLDGLGAVGDGAHANHEFLFIDKMVERSALLALLLMAP